MTRGMYTKLLALLAAAATFAGFSLNAVAQEEYEYEPGEGYHEEEWYDPSDWDIWDYDETVEYEDDDWWDYDYDAYYDDDYGYDDDYAYDDGTDYYDETYGYASPDMDDDTRYTTDVNESLFDDEYDYNYWTDDWDSDNSDFDAWYE